MPSRTRAAFVLATVALLLVVAPSSLLAATVTDSPSGDTDEPTVVAMLIRWLDGSTLARLWSRGVVSTVSDTDGQDDGPSAPGVSQIAGQESGEGEGEISAQIDPNG